MKDANRFTLSFSAVNCRLRHKTLIAAPEPITLDTSKNLNRYKGIIQMKDGEILGHYKGFRTAENATGVMKCDIRRVCQGTRKTAGGLQWWFA